MPALRGIRARSETLLCVVLGDTCSRFVETKQGFASSNAVKHNTFDKFLHPMPNRCILGLQLPNAPGASQMHPRPAAPKCFSNGSQMMPVPWLSRLLPQTEVRCRGSGVLSGTFSVGPDLLGSFPK